MGTTQRSEQEIHRKYWISNIIVMSVLLCFWAAIGLGGGILFADVLNNVNLPNTGIPLGFWMAHQGSIIGFVFIILIYCIAMNFLDKRHHRQLASFNKSNS